MKCSIQNCSAPAKARGWCKIHWQRWSRTGSPDDPVEVSWQERFWSKVDKRGPGECWPWLGTMQSRGYGAIKIDGYPYGAHVVMWELYNSTQATKGMHIGHTCHDSDLSCKGGNNCHHRKCVNPNHLRQMTVAENIRSGRRVTKAKAAP